MSTFVLVYNSNVITLLLFTSEIKILQLRQTPERLQSVLFARWQLVPKFEMMTLCPSPLTF